MSYKILRFVAGPIIAQWRDR